MTSPTRLCGLALLGTLLVAASLATAADVRINLGTLAPRGSSYHQALQLMAEEWRAAPDAGVRLVIYPDGAQGGEADMVRLLRVGTLQAALITAVGLSEVVPEVVALQSVPMLYRSFDELEHVTGVLQPELSRRFAAKDLVVLFWSDAGWVHYFATEPLLTPPDLKRARIFVWAGNDEQVRLMRNAGYHPVPLETADIVQSLSTGRITALTVPPIFALVGQFERRAPHMTALNWAPIVGACVVRKDVWERLSPGTRARLERAAQSAGRYIRAHNRQESEQAIARMQSNGLTVHRPTPEQEAEWRRAIEALYPEIRGAIVPTAMFDEVQRILADYRTRTRQR